jgi:hypothetical protein
VTVVADILASDSAKNKSLELAVCVASLLVSHLPLEQALDGGKF